jgi:3-oxoacyl-[acyl-carrier protein] reductase
MMNRKKGVIINIVSSSARMADDEYGPYTATKWGLAGYTTSLARSIRPYGVRVNGINPGWVDTDMARDLQPLGNPSWSSADDIARAALYLAADAPPDMTGQFMDIFGS